MPINLSGAHRAFRNIVTSFPGFLILRQEKKQKLLHVRQELRSLTIENF
ncbi:MAG: hypothetical protein ACREOI_34320 [bacterium]